MGVPSGDGNSLVVQKLVETVAAALLAKATAGNAPEGGMRQRRHTAIHIHPACLEALRESVYPLHVGGFDVGRKAVLRAVGDLDGLVFGRELEHGEHGAKNLCLCYLAVRVN